ncbi:MAG TPA: glycerophosphodiester phosphodiesterase family protein [Micromonosporaceae bacterium]|nr:glycerophosphodiester phosphodiesterase family protein [Micromonosporaceae bacterium]
MTALPHVYAHRGSSAALPEHTLAAYLRALADGADGVECDVRLTRDGHLVCVHDRRLERTSNGRGRVSSRTLAELDELDFGSWHEAGPAVAPAPEADVAGDDPPDPDRVRLLTLDRLLHALRDAGRGVHLLVETKHPTRYGSRVERRLVDLLSRHGLATPRPDGPVRVTVMSFSPLALRHVHALAPDLPTVLLLEVLPPGLRLGRLPFGVRIAGPSMRLVRTRPALISALRAAGNQAYVWTVNEPDDVDLVARLGVEGIITDRPREVLAQLGR